MDDYCIVHGKNCGAGPSLSGQCTSRPMQSGFQNVFWEYDEWKS